MAEENVKNEDLNKQIHKEKYVKPEAGNVKKPDRAAFACEPCEHEHDGAGDRCSGL